MPYKKLLELIRYIYQEFNLSRHEKDIILFRLQDVLRSLDVYKYLEEKDEEE